MENHSRKIALRWAQPIVILASAAFMLAYKFWDALQGSAGLKSNTLFIPDKCALLFWAVVYIGFFIYSIYQILPAQRNKLLYDRLSAPVLFTIAISVAWQIVNVQGRIGMSALITFAALINAWVMWQWVRSRIADCSYNQWIGVPFSIYAGWITSLTIGGLSDWLSTSGWYGVPLGNAMMNVIMIISGVITGIALSIKHNDWLYPAVIALTFACIWHANHHLNAVVALTAILSGIALGIWSAGFAIFSRLRTDISQL
ncbi:MAG TPA: hypothetical protein VK174_13850 [Chitinophagales bacterium]|nr:hypothetical protein [Chitinophagales bacterium]